MTGEEAYWAGLGPEDCEPEWTRADEEAMLAQADYYDELARDTCSQKVDNKMQFVIRLKNGSYWISRDGNATTGHIDAAARYQSRWEALSEMSKAGPVMHEAAIVPYERPSERSEKASQ